jgi:hypothetical protein
VAIRYEKLGKSPGLGLHATAPIVSSSQPVLFPSASRSLRGASDPSNANRSDGPSLDRAERLDSRDSARSLPVRRLSPQRPSSRFSPKSRALLANHEIGTTTLERNTR